MSDISKAAKMLRTNRARITESMRDGWGHQIRSYVLDQSRIKDLRTNVETSNVAGVLDGDLDQFIVPMLLRPSFYDRPNGPIPELSKKAP